MEILIRILQEGGHSLVIRKGHDVRSYDSRGVADLYRIYTETPELLEGAEVADKVVGKGAAALMILGKVSRVWAGVMSEAAIELFRTSAVKAECLTQVPGIINRNGTGPCPVEKLCADCATADECMPLITKFIESNRKQ